MDRLTRMHVKILEQEEKTPRTEAAFKAYIHDASLEGIRKEMRKLETELIAEREQRKLAARVATDALDARNRAEADRDTARAERDKLAAEIQHYYDEGILVRR